MPLRLADRAVTLGRLSARPSLARLVVRDAAGLEEPLAPDSRHLAAVMVWLARAQDRSGCGGLSAGYSYKRGWLPPYPETTGYAIPTFLAWARASGRDEAADRAVRMGDWEMDIQLPDGGVPGGMGVSDEPVVFNTGQVIFGWLALHELTGRAAYLEAAVRAGDWLAAAQDEDGRWTCFTYQGVPHAYHARVAWALLELEARVRLGRHGRAAERQVAWVLSGAHPNGWLEHMAFHPREAAFTHTVAYTYRGLLEAARHLGGDLGRRSDLARRADRVVARAAHRLLRRFELSKPHPEGLPRYLPATLDADWRGDDTYSCLTGNLQIALIWMRLYARQGDARYLNAALKAIDQVKARQALGTGNADVRGAISGSHPLWGYYLRLAFPNWAAKFFADALMLQEELMAGLEAAP